MSLWALMVMETCAPADGRIIDHGEGEGEPVLPSVAVQSPGGSVWVPGARAGVPGLSVAGKAAVGTSTLPGAPTVTGRSTRLLSGSLARGCPGQGVGGSQIPYPKVFPSIQTPPQRHSRRGQTEPWAPATTFFCVSQSRQSRKHSPSLSLGKATEAVGPKDDAERTPGVPCSLLSDCPRTGALPAVVGHLVAQESLQLVRWGPGVAFWLLHLVAQVCFMWHLWAKVLTEGALVHPGSAGTGWETHRHGAPPGIPQFSCPSLHTPSSSP